jgi:hypothetical protein
MARNTPIIMTRESGKGKRKDNVRLIAGILLSKSSESAGIFLRQDPLLIIHPSSPKGHFGLTYVKILCNIDVIDSSL